MNTREIENAQPFQSRVDNNVRYPYTKEGQTKRAEDARITVMVLGRANMAALEAVNAAMLAGDMEAANKAMKGYRVGLFNAAKQNLEEAIEYLKRNP